MKTALLILSLYFVLLSCSDDTSSKLVGAWEIDQLKIQMNSFKNSDSSKTIEATGKNWEEKNKVRNIRTFYNADGTYHSVHKTLKDSIFYDPAGTWKIENDTLTIQDTIPKRVTYKFKIKMSESFVEYWGVEDFDGDGKVDDDYYSKQVKVK